MEKDAILNVSIREEKEGGYSIICTDLDIASQGETINEAISNIKEAIELYMESAEELGIMDEILEKLGLREEDIREKSFITSRILRTEIPIKITA